MILEVKNVSYYYKSQRDKLILDHVSYGFECGKLYAILGPSGSGCLDRFAPCYFS